MAFTIIDIIFLEHCFALIITIDWHHWLNTWFRLLNSHILAHQVGGRSIKLLVNFEEKKWAMTKFANCCSAVVFYKCSIHPADISHFKIHFRIKWTCDSDTDRFLQTDFISLGNTRNRVSTINLNYSHGYWEITLDCYSNRSDIIFCIFDPMGACKKCLSQPTNCLTRSHIRLINMSKFSKKYALWNKRICLSHFKCFTGTRPNQDEQGLGGNKTKHANKTYSICLFLTTQS